jgi:hypothetical protein
MAQLMMFSHCQTWTTFGSAFVIGIGDFSATNAMCAFDRKTVNATRFLLPPADFAAGVCLDIRLTELNSSCQCSAALLQH